MEDIYSLTESSSFIPICVEAIGQLQISLSVSIAASPISAERNQDFFFTDNVITFSPDNSQECFDFTVVEDQTVEADELAMIRLDQNSDRADIPSPTVVVTIEDSSTVSFSFLMDVYDIIESETAGLCVMMQGVTTRDIAVTLSDLSG